MEKLLELPPLALITFGCVLALIFGVRYLGLWQGHNSPQSNSGQATVAAVIVDPTALNGATAAVSGLALAVQSLVVTLNAMNVTASRTAEELDAVREELRIHREVARRGP